MSTSISETTVPRMGAEAGYGVEETPPPLRVSGYVCLILGLASFFALFGPGALVIPLLAILSGFFALRGYGEQVPAGLKPARVGLVLAFGFGSAGLAIPLMKSYTLGRQAEQFARDYIEMIARGEFEVAMELQKAHYDRFPSTMPLKAYYAQQEATDEDSPESPIRDFRNSGLNKTIKIRGPGAEWRLAKPVRVHSHYGLQLAEVVLKDPTGEVESDIVVELRYRIDEQGDGQWNVERAMFDADVIVAPSIL